MIKIGFIDNFLSEWHANNYPAMIRKNLKAQAAGMDVCYAFAKTPISLYDGVSTSEWCAKYGVSEVASIDEIVNLSDCIVVLSPDNPELHFEISYAALKSGKPVYIDKTFAQGKESAKDIFELANKHNTPVFSSSSLRFSGELKKFREDETGAKSCVATGPYLFSIYAVHIFEMIATVMKTGAQRLMAVQNGKNRSIIIDYGNGRSALFNQNETGDAPFSVSVEKDGADGYFGIKSNYFENFIDELVSFFIDKKPRVSQGETVEIMAMLECAAKALNKPFCWHSLI